MTHQTAIKVLEEELESLNTRISYGVLYPLVEEYRVQVSEIEETIKLLKKLELDKK